MYRAMDDTLAFFYCLTISTHARPFDQRALTSIVWTNDKVPSDIVNASCTIPYRERYRGFAVIGILVYW